MTERISLTDCPKCKAPGKVDSRRGRISAALAMGVIRLLHTSAEELEMKRPQPMDDYLVWSHERAAWWRSGPGGYSRQIIDAGRYSRDAALKICVKAVPGETAQRLGVLPELPVRLADLEAIMRAAEKGKGGGR